MADNSKYLVGIFDDEDVLMKAVSKVRGSGIKIEEVYTPFPMHGLDKALGYEHPRMGVAAFLFGMTGTVCALLLTFWTMGVDWPMNIGGKNFFPFPTNIPIMFELTVLFAAFGMVGTFLVMHGLKPSAEPRIFDLRITDDKFAMVVNLSDNKQADETIAETLKGAGAIEVNAKQF